jgi:hypothetical protein
MEIPPFDPFLGRFATFQNGTVLAAKCTLYLARPLRYFLKMLDALSFA